MECGYWVDSQWDIPNIRSLDTSWFQPSKPSPAQGVHYNGPWDTTEGENALRAPWPDDIQPSTTISLPYDWETHEPYPQIAIGLIPTTVSWQVPAYLRFGDFNACHTPAEHVSVIKRWQEQYGAEIVSMNHDTIELRVAAPPQDRAQTINLAYEQFAYCWDIVDQGVGTLDALAATLLTGTIWFFWWD